MNISIQRLTENSLIVKLVIETENNYYIVAISLQMLLSKYTEHFYTIHVPCAFPTLAIMWFSFENLNFLICLNSSIPILKKDGLARFK